MQGHERANLSVALETTKSENGEARPWLHHGASRSSKQIVPGNHAAKANAGYGVQLKRRGTWFERSDCGVAAASSARIDWPESD